VHSLQTDSVTDEMAIHSSFSINIHDHYIVFMTATAENPVTNKYAVIKESKEVKPLLLCLVNSESHFSQVA